MTKRPSLSKGMNISKLAENMKALSEPTAPNPAALVEKAQTTASSSEPKLAVRRYEGMKKMLIPLDPTVHRKLKILAVQKDMTLEKIVQDAIEKYLSMDC